MKASILKYIALTLFLVSLVWSILYQYSSIQLPLGFDEVDYYDASKVRLSDQWLCRSENNVFQFFKLAYAKYKKIDVNFKVENEEKDLFLLRHFHGALPGYYWNVLIKVSDWFSWKVDAVLKVGNILLMISVVLYYIFSLKYTRRLYMIFPLLGLMCVSPWFYETFDALNFHIFLGIASLFYWQTLKKFIEEDSRKNVFWLSLAIAIMLLTLETFIVLLGISFIVIWFAYHKRMTWRNIGWSMFLALLLLIVLNPGTFKSWDFIKSWFMYAYRIVLKSNQEYSGVSPWQNWMLMLQYNAAYVTVILYLIFMAWKNKIKEVVLPFFMGVGYLLFITFFSISNSYFFPGFILLTLSGLLVLCSEKIQWNMVSQASLLLASVLALAIMIYAVDFTARTEASRRIREKHENDMKFISERIKTHQQGLSEVYHILNKYTNLRHTQKLVVEGNDELIVRLNYQNLNFDAYQAANKIDYVVFRKEKVSPAIEKHLMTLDYQLVELNYYTLFLKQ